ncbi:hypothetical protein PSTEL_13115 [Paenibacillus stellifer]|uniref:Uncharacterized protein n=1 Tax=Paenibacillus stellifer TaxID=169760 RepID=A0A089N5B1_9BACL|nr:hypothetical protein [Paenibacillus stellifer]AIQ63884.1 hypothetical protein PSTEL_13115 [Paenibacillus stellifer]
MKKEKKPLDIVFVNVEGDPITAIAQALEPGMQEVLKQHDAHLTTPLVDILRKHAKKQPVNMGIIFSAWR